MNPTAYIPSSTEQVLALANLSFNDGSIIDLVQAAVGVLFSMGFWSFLYSQLRLSVRDQGGLDKVRQACGSEEKIELNQLKGMMSDSRIASSLVYERIKTIVDMFNSAGDATIAQPKLQDLHRMSEQSMFSRSGATLLRMMTNVLLIVGICGTLWGVHSALGIRANAFEINSLSYALGPSKYAVLGTIILLVCRSIFEARVERHICDMDSFTMSRLLPYLQGHGTEQSALLSLTSSIQKFTKLQQNCNIMIERMNIISETLSQPPSAFLQMKNELETILASLRAEETKQQDTEKEEQQQVDGAAEILSMLRSSLNNMTAKQEKISQEWIPLQENLLSINTDVKLVADAGASIEKLIEQVNSASKQLKTAEAIHQDASKLREELSSAASLVSGEIRDAMAALEQLDSRTEQVQQKVDTLQSTQQDLQKVVHEAGSRVTALAGSASSFAENLDALEQKVGSAVSKIDSATQAVEIAAQDGVRHLDSIRSRVNTVLKKAESSPTHRKRKKS